MNQKKIKITAMSSVLIAVFTLFFIIKPQDTPSDCFIWKVKIDESTFFLAGSIHAANETDYPLSKNYIKKYKDADKVIFELAEDFETIETKLFQYAEKDKLEKEQYLDLHLTNESLNKLEQLFEEERLKKYFQHEAWVLNMAIAGSKSKLIGYDPILAIDKYFHDLAQKDKKDIIGLESLQTQIEIFEFEVPYEMQIKIIEKAVTNMEKQAENEIPLYKAYFENNLEEFEDQFLKSYNFDNPQLKLIYDRVFTNRNTKWVEILENLAQENQGTYFVLVGAGHYFGPNNMREILSKKGYVVKKI